MKYYPSEQYTHLSTSEFCFQQDTVLGTEGSTKTPFITPPHVSVIMGTLCPLPYNLEVLTVR